MKEKEKQEMEKYNLMFINMSDKQKVINDIYFDRSGFGSKKLHLMMPEKKISQSLWMM